MAEFGASATLSFEVPDRELRRVRREIEDELTDVAVGLGGSGAGSRSGGSRTMRVLEREQQLSRVRNDLLRDIRDTTEQQTFDRVSGGGIGGAIGLGLGLTGLGLGLGGLGLAGLSQTLQNFDPDIDLPNIPPLPVDAPSSIPLDAPSEIPLEVPDIPPLSIPEPDWLPIVVQPPSGTGSGGTTGAPAPVPAPTLAPGPGGTGIPMDDSPGGTPTPTPSPGPDPFSVTGRGAAVAGGSALAGGGAALLANSVRGVPGAAPAGVGFPTFAPAIASRAAEAEQTPPGERGFLDRILARLTPNVNQNQALQGRTPTATSTASVSAAEPSQRAEVTVQNNATYNVSGLQELRREQERNKQELERKLERVKRNIAGSSF